MKASYNVEGFTQRLRNTVAESNMTLEDIARKSEVGRTNLWGYLVAGVNPSIYTLKRLAITLNVSADYLLGIEGKK